MTSPTLDITRGEFAFAVLDDPETRSWNFWEQQYASGVWEAEVLDTIESLLAAGGTYIDIGAWVGPTVLWAAQFADHVLALEPDPVAVGILLANVGMNLHNVTIWPAAVTNGMDGSVTMRSWRWGNSSSTLVPAERLRAHNPDLDEIDEVDVPAVDFADVIQRTGRAGPALVKIDIEGGEEDLVGRLDVLTCPIILSLHLPWIGDPDGVRADMHRLGRVDYLDDHADFPVVLITP